MCDLWVLDYDPEFGMGEEMFKDLRSLHSPPFSGRTPGGLRWTRPIQNANFLALEWLELSGDFPVTFRCMLVGLVSPTDFLAGLSVGLSPNQQSNSTGNDRTAAESPNGSPADSNGHQASSLPY
jgi:hypothetical protein